MKRWQRWSPRVGGAPTRDGTGHWGEDVGALALKGFRNKTGGVHNHLERDFQAPAPNTKMGHRHYRCSYGRTLAVSLHPAGLVFGCGRRLGNKSATGSPIGGPGGINGGGATAWPDTGHSALGSRLSGYVRRVPVLLSGPPPHVQHAHGWELCRQCGSRKFL